MKKTVSIGLAFLLFLCLTGPAPAAELDPTHKPDLSLDDLGFTESQTAGNADQQKVFEKRSRMLKTHQILGLATAVPMIAAVMTSEKATSEGSKSGRNTHMYMGMTAGAMYFTTAYFSLTAPEIEGAKSRGATKIHKALAFIHFPLMLMAPIAGYQAKKQLDRGEEAHGFAKHHAEMAGIAAGAFGASMLVMVFNF